MLFVDIQPVGDEEKWQWCAMGHISSSHIGRTSASDSHHTRMSRRAGNQPATSMGWARMSFLSASSSLQQPSCTEGEN